MRLLQTFLLCFAIVAAATRVAAQDPAPLPELPAGSVEASLDLATDDGVRRVQGEWRYHDVRVTDIDFRAAGPDRKPSGPVNRTYDIEPHAGGADFDDSSWDRIAPATLESRRAAGKLCFAWYRIRITLPERIGDVAITGSTVVFETVVDDYAEVWVDGQLPRRLGQRGDNLIAGWNAANRVVLTRDARPGQQVQLAIFGVNGPVSDPPANYIWMRSAKLTFHRVPRALAPVPVATRIERAHPDLDAIVPPGATIEKLVDGLTFGEGPVWLPEGALVFSDPNRNVIWKWTPDNTLSLFRDRSGYDGSDIAQYRQPGSNGLTLDPQGRLTIDQHGNRRVVRLEPDGSLTVLADRYLGKRLNSPNDLVYRSDGTLFFTDPPFGLPQVHDDPRRELAFFGVYALSPAGKLQLVSRDFRGPNGLALSPDEKVLYVANWDERHKVVMRYDVRRDGSLGRGALFYDLTAAPGAEALDGLKVDRRGNVYVSGPGGVWVFSPQGTHLGTIAGPELAANFAWGDADGKTLYMTARSGLYRIRLAVEGVRPTPQFDHARR
jgi:gluconolactonase